MNSRRKRSPGVVQPFSFTPMFLAGLAAAWLPSCSVEPNEDNIKTEKTVTGEIAVRDTTIAEAGSGTTGGGNQSELSLALFTEHVYPLLKKNCASCHGASTAPVFASDDELSSFQALSNSNKVNFDNPVQSRIVLRLSQDLHNCWSECSENATVMKSAVDNWKAGLDSGGGTGGKSFPFKTAEIALTQVRTSKTADPTKPGIIVFEAESTTLKAPFASASDANASGGKLISSTTGGAAPAGLAETVADTSGLGSFTIEFETGEDGFFQVFARVRAPSNNENTVYYKMNNDAMKTWSMTTGGALGWQQLSQQENNAGPQKFELKKGKNTLVIYQAEDNILFDKFIITNRTLGDYDDYEVSPLNNASLLFTLKGIIGIDVFFAIAVEQLDATTYLLRSPVLINESGRTVSVRGIYPLLNGVWSEQNATYSKTKASSNERILSLSTAAMTMVADKGFATDKLTIGLDELKIVD